jgi:tetratricopeptide (TPR) repeat protein
MGRYLEARDLISKEPSRFGDMVHNTFASRWLLHLFKGILNLEKPQRETAHDEFTKAKALSPDPFSYHFTLGRLLSESGEFPTALEELHKALDLNPGEPKVLWNLSYVYAVLGKPAEQMQWLDRLLAIAPEFPGAHFQAGIARMRLGNYAHGRDFFQKARVLRPGDQSAMINEALCLRGMGRFEESISLSREFKPASRTEEITLLLNRACCYHALGQDELAIEHFTELAQNAPESLEAPVYLSRLFLKKGEIESCVDQCDRLLKLLGMDRSVTLNTVSDLGAIYFRAGELLSVSHHRDDLTAVAREIGRQLTPQ